MALPTDDELVQQTIAAYRAGDVDHASELLARSIKLDPNNVRAWLWLSGVVATDGERLFCIKRILAIDPANDVAQRGLAILPAGLEPLQPSLPKAKTQDAEICTFPGCNKPVSRPGFKFCYKHWRAVNLPLEPAATLNATALSERLNLSSHRVNLVLAELGWTGKERKGWVLTPQGASLGAVQREHHQTGIPYVLWPESVLENRALSATIKSLNGDIENVAA